LSGIVVKTLLIRITLLILHLAPVSCLSSLRTSLPILLSFTMSAPASDSSDRAAADRAERAREHRAALSGPPGREQDRCYELSKKSLRCQMDAQIKLNQVTQTAEVLRICKYDVQQHALHQLLGLLSAR
jgi:hypothetical protein